METHQDIFLRSRLLLGSDFMQLLAQKRLIVFGIGGVGSWCVESLVRTGLGHVTLVDFDRINHSNINRQAMATSITVGRNKVDVLKERLLEINPAAHIETFCETYSKTNAHLFDLNQYDFVVDAIDSLSDKAELILQAGRSKAYLISSMGAARKLDPGKIKVAEFWKVFGCPLAAALRRKFRHEKNFPAVKFPCVFSDEVLENKETLLNEERTNGSLMHITASFGLRIAYLVIERLRQELSAEK